MKRWGGIGGLIGLLLLALLAPPAGAASLQQVGARFACTTGEAVTVGQALMMKSDGLCYKADADDSALRPAIGIAATSALISTNVGVVTAGQVGGATALTKGGAVYLHTTAGGVTQTQPSAYSQTLGRAISATQWVIGIQPPKPTQLLITAVENLAGGADIGDGTAANGRTVYTAPRALTLKSVSIYGRAAASGIDNSNTAVLKVYNGTSTVVTKTFDSTTAWPAAFTATSLGTLTNTAVAADGAIKFDLVDGAAADPPAFDVLIEYYVTD